MKLVKMTGRAIVRILDQSMTLTCPEKKELQDSGCEEPAQDGTAVGGRLEKDSLR